MPTGGHVFTRMAVMVVGMFRFVVVFVFLFLVMPLFAVFMAKIAQMGFGENELSLQLAELVGFFGSLRSAKNADLTVKEADLVHGFRKFAAIFFVTHMNKICNLKNVRTYPNGLG